MKQLRFPTLFLAVTVCSVLAHAQDGSTAQNLAGCGACSAIVLIPVIIAVVIIALNIALLVWVARDAKARGMDSAVLWMLFVFFTSFIGLIVYLFARPQGNMVQCGNCGNKRLQSSVKCPSCGIGG